MITETSIPLWMNDPLMQNISKEKKEFLYSLYTENQVTSQKDFLLKTVPKLKEAKQKGLLLNRDEWELAIAAIKKYTPKEDIDRISKLINNKA